jgi:hypothetical protein
VRAISGHDDDVKKCPFLHDLVHLVRVVMNWEEVTLQFCVFRCVFFLLAVVDLGNQHFIGVVVLLT